MRVLEQVLAHHPPLQPTSLQRRSPGWLSLSRIHFPIDQLQAEFDWFVSTIFFIKLINFLQQK